MPLNASQAGRWMLLRLLALSLVGMLCLATASAAELSFDERMTQGEHAAETNVSVALELYEAASLTEATNAANLCRLARNYCDLMALTNSTAGKKAILDLALQAALLAVKADPSNATAHASLAVCYAKSCAFAGLKTKLNYSRLFKAEAERAIALDPQQDIAWYLLGRWHYELANVGFLSRTVVKVVYGSLPKASYAEAIKNFSRAVELAPNRILHHAGLAQVYRRLGDSKNERAELALGIALSPVDREDAEILKDMKTRWEEIAR